MDKLWISGVVEGCWSVFGVEVDVKSEVKVKARFVFFSIKAANKEGEGGRLGIFGKCGRLLA